MHLLYYRPSIFSHFNKELHLAESTRLGGVSTGCYKSLNLSFNNTDTAENVVENRKRLAKSLGYDIDQLASIHQVHGDRVLRIHQPGHWQAYDGLITNKKGIVLAISIADCTPVLIYDPSQKAIGAVHAGWKGTVAQITAQALLAMRDAFGTKPADCWAYIGSCIGANDFEVDADVADHFDEKYKTWNHEKKKFFVDLKTSNLDQLTRLGVSNSQIAISPHSTYRCTDRYFSHRAEQGKTGRMLAVIGMK